VAAHTCAEHRELAGELLLAGMPRGRTLDRWLPASVRWSPAQQLAPPGPAYQLTVTLDEVYPPVWRRIHVPARMSLAALHDVVVVAMGWEGYHLSRFGMLAFGDVCGEHDPTTALDVVLRKPGDRLGYLYDFGDLWIHHIELDKVITRPRATRGTEGFGPGSGVSGRWCCSDAWRGVRCGSGIGSAQQQPGKRLGRPGGGVVVLAAGGLDGESGSKLFGELGGAVAGDWEPGAVFGSVGGEGGEDEVAAWGDVRRGELAVAGAVVRLGQEVKHRSVMPQREGCRRCPPQQVGGFPPHQGGTLGKPVLGEVKGVGGHVEHRQIRMAPFE
jgi:hypothetical protein